MSGVYTLGASEGTTISNYIIHHIYSNQYGGWGLYTDQASSYKKIENNLVYACKDAGFYQNFGKENIIHNNIFALNFRSDLVISSFEKHTSFIFSNNIIYYDEGILY